MFLKYSSYKNVQNEKQFLSNIRNRITNSLSLNLVFLKTTNYELHQAQYAEKQ
jgi:hypothetical protein